MIKMQENVILKSFTSMYVGGPARFFTLIRSEDELVEALKFSKDKNLPVFVLGGGSNVLISDKGFNGVVLKIEIAGVTLLEETEDYVFYKVGGGEKWDDFVKFTVESGLYGIENMSHVPGTVGASIVQNIGCYGQEVSEVFVSAEVIRLTNLDKLTLDKNALKFSYRKSALNDPDVDKSKYVVTNVVFKLNKKGKPNLSYGDLQKYFSGKNLDDINLKSVREAVIYIRNSKFPFPDSPKNGTCGSFWNTPVVDKEAFEKIISKLKSKGFQNKADEVSNKRDVFVVAQGFKIACGLLVDALGFKGKKVGGARILETHSGIINNYTGEATAQDVFNLSKEITDKVEAEFGIKMKIEPELVGFN